MPDDARVLIGRVGALKSWSRTVDRTARTRNARANGPAADTYWLNRLGPEFKDASDAQRLAAADAMRRAYYARIALKSAQVRRRKSVGDAA